MANRNISEISATQSASVSLDSGQTGKEMQSSKEVPLYSCHFCEKSFKDRTSLQIHVFIHRAEKQFDCEHCEKSFIRKKDLYQHTLTHTQQRKHVCDICEKRFRRTYDLQSHMKTHSTDAPLACPHCGKGFKYNSSLKEHIVRHLGEKPHNCDICGKSFASRSNYRRHARTHSQDKPHECNLCTKKFKSRSDLNVHMFYHSGERPFSCSYCDKSFSYNRDLTKHVRTHTGEKPFGCDHCGKRFTQAGHLQTHLQKHTSDNPFSCDLCGVTFRYINSYKKHMVKHATDKKSYNCEHCDETFSTAVEIRSHVKVHIEGRDDQFMMCEDIDEDADKMERLGMLEETYSDEETANKRSRSIENICDELEYKKKIESQIQIKVQEEFPSQETDCLGNASLIAGGEKMRQMQMVNDTFSCYLCGEVFPVDNILQQHIESHIEDEITRRKEATRTIRKSKTHFRKPNINTVTTVTRIHDSKLKSTGSSSTRFKSENGDMTNTENVECSDLDVKGDKANMNSADYMHVDNHNMHKTLLTHIKQEKPDSIFDIAKIEGNCKESSILKGSVIESPVQKWEVFDTEILRCGQK